MGKGRNITGRKPPQKHPQNSYGTPELKMVNSLLDEMQDGNEYGSIVGCGVNGLDLVTEFRRGMEQISAIRERPVVCYLANVVNPKITVSTGIDTTDDLPFSEMIEMIDQNDRNLDIILVTPGGYAEQVAKFVNKLRPRFDSVGFILPYMAMSAGTIFALSGDELIMDSRAYIGPIDPQVPSKEGRYIPAQAIMALIKAIQDRGAEQLANGLQPDWTDILILNQLDGKEIGYAISASNFSIELVTSYLANYKFKNWTIHQTTGAPVTYEEKCTRAKEIAEQLCDHVLWKTHSRGISREMAHSECRLKIIHPEDIPGLLSAIRKFWALAYYSFERTPMVKAYISGNYSILRNQPKI